MERNPSKQELLDQELADDVAEKAGENKTKRGNSPHQDRFHEKRDWVGTQYRKPSKKKSGNFLDRAYATESSEMDFLLEAMPAIVSEFGSSFAREAVRASDSFSFIRRTDARYFQDDFSSRDIPGLDLLGSTGEEDDTLIALLPEIMGLRWQRSNVVKTGVDIIVSSRDDSTKSISRDYDSFMASRRAYTLIKRGVAPSKASQAMLEGFEDSRRTQLSPLVDLLSKPEVGAAVRAETFSRMSLYISSGWAEDDLREDNADPQAAKIRSLIQKMRDGGEVSLLEVSEAMQDRLTNPKIFIQGVVETRGGKYKIKKITQQRLSEIRRDMFDGDRTQGSGMVDCIVRDARDPSLITMAVVTADPDFVKARDQLARHAMAIQNSIDAGDEPFRKGDRLASIQMHSLAMLPEENRSKLREELSAAYEAAGLTWDNRKDTDFYNLQVLFSLLGASSARGLDANVVLQTRHKRYGAGNTPFENREELDQVREVATYFAENIKRLGAASAYLRLSDPSSPRPKPAMLQPLTMLMESLDGLQQRYGSIRTDDPRANEKEKTTALFVRETIASVLPEIKAIAEMGAAQDNQLEFVNIACRVIGRHDARWITDYHAHVVDEDDQGRAISVHATSRKRAEELWEREKSTQNRQERLLKHIDDGISDRNMSDNTRASMAGVRKALAFAAVKFDDQTIDSLISMGIGRRIQQNHKEVVIPSSGKITPLMAVTKEQMMEVARTICNAPSPDSKLAHMLSVGRQKRKEKMEESSVKRKAFRR